MKHWAITIFVLFSTLAATAQIPTATHIQILKAEDARRYDKTLEDLLRSQNAQVRERAALAAGRIGREEAIPALAELLANDRSEKVRAMVAFALGEIESVKSADVIVGAFRRSSGTELPNENDAGAKPASVVARLIEAAGKIAAADPKSLLATKLQVIILDQLGVQAAMGRYRNTSITQLGLTAALRAKPDGVDAVVAKFLSDHDPAIRVDALNALARLRSKQSLPEIRSLLERDTDGTVRANAARALGAAEDKDALEILLNAATTDKDSRVRVSAIRSLGSLKDARAADHLIERGERLLKEISIPDGAIVPWYGQKPRQNQPQRSELIEIATSLARLLPNTNNGKAVDFLNRFGKTDRYTTTEVLIAIATVSPQAVFDIARNDTACYGIGFMPGCERYNRNRSLAFAEFAKLPPENSFHIEVMKTLEQNLARMAESVAPAIDDQTSTIGLIEAYAAFKDAKPEFVLPYLKLKYGYAWNPFIRATAAGMLADQPKSNESIDALRSAFTKALLTDKRDNDAQLAILDALYKLDKKESVGTLLAALNATDYLVRKKAFELLSDMDLQKDFPSIATSLENARKARKDQVLPYDAKSGTKLGQVLNTDADYRRALARKNGSVKAVLRSEKGMFSIILYPEEAPLTVDNFIKLARSKYFDGLEVHRVVPNFVMQDGDPRGDGNGGPGWSIRCEVNMLPYERGAVGMALSGKDTGGSQWFVTHSPQPHLDGGYTVFGRVSETDMKVVDSIVRGDKILSVTIVRR